MPLPVKYFTPPFLTATAISDKMYSSVVTESNASCRCMYCCHGGQYSEFVVYNILPLNIAARKCVNCHNVGSGNMVV